MRFFMHIVSWIVILAGLGGMIFIMLFADSSQHFVLWINLLLLDMALIFIATLVARRTMRPGTHPHF